MLLRRLLLISGFAVTVAVLAPAAVTVAVLAPATAEAAEITASGWWTTTPVAVAPDAQGGLVVQGGPQADQPLSYAAVQFSLEDGERASGLSLTTAPSSGSTPGTTLTVCPLTDSFAPADGGAMADAPRYDCSSKASSAAINGVYAFDLSSMPTSGALALAVLPGAPGDRVVLTKPDRDAVRTSVAASPAGGDAPGAAVDAPAPPAGAAGSFDLPATSPAAVAPPAGPVPAPPARAIGASDSPRALGIGADRTSDRGRPIVRVVFVLLALAAVALWMAAGHHSTRGEIADG